MAIRPVVICVVVAAILCVLPILSGTADAAGVAAAQGRRGERAVLGDLDLRTPAGKHVSLIPLVGSKAIVVVFWSASCAGCAEEVSRLNDLNDDRLIKVVAVNEGDDVKKINDFASKHQVAYEIVMDPKGSVASAFEVPGVPSCVILSRSGLIVYRGSFLPEEIEYYVAQ